MLCNWLIHYLCFVLTLLTWKTKQVLGSNQHFDIAHCVHLLTMFLWIFALLVHVELTNAKRIGFVYFIYLFLFSGLEFTLTFLTHSILNYTRYVSAVIAESINLKIMYIICFIACNKGKCFSLWVLWWLLCKVSNVDICSNLDRGGHWTFLSGGV